MSFNVTRPLAIAMWDFSWIERTYTGGGFDNWDKVVGELKERGYDAVRIDAFPHFLVHVDVKTWEVDTVWKELAWGTPGKNRITDFQQRFVSFIRVCKKHDILVALSSWFREDSTKVMEKVKKPDDLTAMWKKTLDIVHDNNLLDSILYVDLCNEYPMWASFLPEIERGPRVNRVTNESKIWADQAISTLKTDYPDLMYTCSSTVELYPLVEKDFETYDFLELHFWMSHYTNFYQQLGYTPDNLTTDFTKMQKAGELYWSNPEYWRYFLRSAINYFAQYARQVNKPLITTECWAVIFYFDWPLVDWGWVKDLCLTGVTAASATGQWVALASSNCCSPQFRGMWDDLEWHKKVTDIIHNGNLPSGCQKI